MKTSLVLLFTLATTPAVADDAPEPAPARRPTYQHAVSLQLATLDPSAASVQFESVAKRRPKTSIALAIGGRSSAQGEYSSRTTGVGIEVKRWLRRPEPMTGWYAGARTDLARTTTRDVMEDREIGTMTTWTAGISTGYRWVLLHKLELTPSIGAAMVVEGGTMSPTTARPAGTIGFTAGYTW
jgi:hypothetical protein